jgi:alcohol dehydrogenase class IV
VRTLTEIGLASDVLVFITAQPGPRSAVDAALEKRGARLDRARVLVKPAGEPTRETVRDGAAFLADGAVRAVVGIGGGSVLDWCRLSWAVAAGRWSLDGERPEPPPGHMARPDFWLVPTTCATGAEAAAVAVYSADGRKIPVVMREFLPDRVLLDGQFLKDLPDATLATLLGDTLTHGVEAFVSIVPGTLAKEAAVSSLRIVLQHFPEAASPSRNERLMEAGFLAGLAASNCSVGIVHAFSHTLAAWDLPHAFCNALGLRAGIRVNASVPAMRQLAERVGAGDVEDLLFRLGAIVSQAGTAPQRSRIASLLRDATTRHEIASRMLGDVCMRTNPQQGTEELAGAFLDEVRREAEL